MVFIILVGQRFLITTANARSLIVVGIPEEPVRWLENGEAKGIDVDIITHILNKLNIPFEIQIIHSQARLQSEWQKGRSDIVFTYSYKPQRAEYLYYSREAHLVQSFHFFILKENQGKWKYRTFEDLKGLVIGVTQGVSYIKEFWQAEKKYGLQFDTHVQQQLVMKKLRKKRLDIAPLNTHVESYRAKQGGYLNEIAYLPKPLKHKYYYNTFVKASNYPHLHKIRKAYETILKQMKKDGTLKKIYSKYVGDIAYPFEKEDSSIKGKLPETHLKELAAFD